MTNIAETNNNGPGKKKLARVVLLADPAALHWYGPVIRRLAIGLIDEVSSISLLSIGDSPLLEYIPSPPIRILTEKHALPEQIPNEAPDAWQITIDTAKYDLLERLLPKRHVQKLAEAIMPLKPTLLHAMSERQVSLVRNLSKILNIPYVLSLLAMDKGSLNISDRRCKAVLCGNSNLARNLRHEYPEFAERIRLLPIGAHVGESPCCFSTTERTPMAICCCRLEHKLGLNTLIHAIRRLHNKGKKLQLTISGEGPAEHDLRQIVDELKLGESVHFVPLIDNILATSDASKHLLEGADIFVQPWAAEMWRPELLEAMSVGNAVVIVEGTGNDLILPGKTALTVNFQDEIKLCETLESLLDDHGRAQELARNAQGHLRKHFLVSTMITRLAGSYRKALDD